jgi:hypothetical protein
VEFQTSLWRQGIRDDFTFSALWDPNDVDLSNDALLNDQLESEINKKETIRQYF